MKYVTVLKEMHYS